MFKKKKKTLKKDRSKGGARRRVYHPGEANGIKTRGALTRRDGGNEAEEAELHGDREQTPSGPGIVAYAWNASSWEDCHQSEAPWALRHSI